MIKRSLDQQIANGMHFAVVCSEDAPRWDQANVSDAGHGRDLHRHHFMAAMRTVCEQWPRGPVDPDFNAPLVSALPTLILSGGNDPVTPARYGEQVHRGLSRSKHLVLAGQGHGQIGLVACRDWSLNSSRPAPSTEIDGDCTKNVAPGSLSAVPLGARSMIQVEGLKKRFGAVQALQDVSFTAGDGRITGLLGHNGAGKSTTLRILSTVIRANEGRALIDGHDCATEPLQVRRSLGVLPHASGLYAHLSGRENIALLRRAARDARRPN